MIRVLLVPSSDYLCHPFPQRHNQIFERLNDAKNFEVHVARFHLFNNKKMSSNVVVHDLSGFCKNSVSLYYLRNAASHASEIRRIIRQESIDIVVLSNLSAPLAYTLMDELSSINIPIVVDLPDYYPTSASGYLFDVQSVQGKILTGYFDLILRRIISHASLVTVVSSALQAHAIHCGAKWVENVPNGISAGFLELRNGTQIREKIGIDSSDFIIGYIGSIEFWLEMKPLLKSVALSARKGLDAKLLLVGKGLHTEFIKKVEQQIREEGIRDKVFWLDFVPYEEVPFYLSAIDVGTIPFDATNPTAYYSSPNKMWEYLSQRKPVISTPIPEALKNQEYLFLSSTPEAYVRLFNSIKDQEPWVLQKVNKGYGKALTKTWDTSTRCLASLLSTCVEQS